MHISVAIFALTVVSFLLGLGRDLAIAKYFGASWLSDALFLALVVPVFFENICGVALRDALIPHLKTLHFKNQAAYEDEINRLGILTLVVSAGILAIFEITPRFWVSLMAPGWDTARLSATTQLYSIGLLLVVVHAWGYFQTAILNSESMFVLPMWRPIMLNIGALAGIFLYPEHLAAILAGMIAFLLCHSLLMQYALGRRGVRLRGLRTFDIRLDQLTFIQRFSPVLGATAALQATVISERVFSSWLPPGSLSALSYGFRLTTVPLVLFSVSILTLIFPALVAHRLEESKDGFCLVLDKGLKATLLFLVPAAVFFQAFAEPLTSVLFEHGVFQAHEREMTASSVGGYAIGLPFMGLALLGSRAMLALNKGRLLLKAALLGMMMTIFAQAVCFKALNTFGLGLALSAGMALQALVLWRDILLFVPMRAFWMTLCRWFSAAWVVGVAIQVWPWTNFFGLVTAGVGLYVGLLACVWFFGERGLFSRQLLRFET